MRKIKKVFFGNVKPDAMLTRKLPREVHFV